MAVKNFFRGIINFFRREEMEFPSDWGIIYYSSHSLTLGVKGNSNKIIKRYFINEYGNVEDKKYRYSEQMVYTLRKLYNIPIYDKTKEEVIYPIFSRIIPGEIKYIR